MANQATQELREFHQFLGDKLNNGADALSPEQALDEWRRTHPENLDEDCQAIQEALDDMANGDKGMLFADFDREFRARHNLPAKS